MSSPEYPASVDNSTVYPPLSDERLILCCYEVLRTFARYSGGEVPPPWLELDRDEKDEFGGFVHDQLFMSNRETTEERSCGAGLDRNLIDAVLCTLVGQGRLSPKPEWEG